MIFCVLCSVSSRLGFLRSPKKTLYETLKWSDAWIKRLIFWYSFFFSSLERSSNWMEIEEGSPRKKVFWRYNIFQASSWFAVNLVEANSLNDKYYFNPCMYPFLCVLDILVYYVINSVFSCRLSMKLSRVGAFRKLFPLRWLLAAHAVHPRKRWFALNHKINAWARALRVYLQIATLQIVPPI